MKNYKLFVLAIAAFIVIAGCGNSAKDRQKSIEEIRQTEKDFETMAAQKGLAEAFYFYADENAVIQYRDTIRKGKENIRKIYQAKIYKDVSLKWSPDFVTVSSGCDLGYTYGRFQSSANDSTGKVIKDKGYFHTVWKKQSDGTWRFVWD